MKLTNGKRYVARISLGMFESIASNETIREKLVDAGFVNVVVTGSGRSRAAIGTWGGATQDTALPSQIVEAKEMS